MSVTEHGGPWRERRGVSGEGRAHRRSREHAERSWPGKDVAPSPRKRTRLGVETHDVTD